MIMAFNNDNSDQIAIWDIKSTLAKKTHDPYFSQGLVCLCVIRINMLNSKQANNSKN